jgi:hypothetical protein
MCLVWWIEGNKKKIVDADYFSQTIFLTFNLNKKEKKLIGHSLVAWYIKVNIGLGVRAQHDKRQLDQVVRRRRRIDFVVRLVPFC